MNSTITPYFGAKIRNNFLNKRLEDFYCDDVKKGLPAKHLKKIDRILVRLNNAEKLASCLNISKVTVSKIINGRASVTANMALRLSIVFNTTSGLGLGLQKQYDLWHTEHDFEQWKFSQRITEGKYLILLI